MKQNTNTATRGTSFWAVSALFLAFAAYPTYAANILFNTDPFAGSTALSTPGRQVVGGELFLNTFDVNADTFVFDPGVFNFTTLTFVNTPASGLPSSGVNVIVLQDSDNDNNAATAFNAGTAANLIANGLTTDGGGFFIYFNSSLSLNRLVYSTNLNSSDADLKILARIVEPTGAAAIAALPTFNSSNFASVPEPATGLMLLTALGGMLMARRFKRS